MASLRKLRRRALRWQRYMAAIRPWRWPDDRRHGVDYPPGYMRAESAVWREEDRRRPPELRWGEGPHECGCRYDDCRDDDYEDDEPAMRVETTSAFQEAGLL